MSYKSIEDKRAHEREYRKRWSAATKEKQLASVRRYAKTAKGKAAGDKRKKEYNARNPDHPKAVQAVKYALRSGKLMRPDRCESCRQPCKPQAHHYKGYAVEHRLTVRWLCHGCHTEQHV